MKNYVAEGAETNRRTLHDGESLGFLYSSVAQTWLSRLSWPATPSGPGQHSEW